MANICKLSVTPQLAFAKSTARMNVAGVRPLPARTSRMMVHASQEDALKRGGPMEMAMNMGFDVSEGLYGFTPFSELWVGRLAMAGFVTGVAEELLTGHTILEQVGLSDGSGYANPVLFSALLALMLVPTGVATASTIFKVSTGEMTLKQFKGYARFFGLDSEEDAKTVSTMRKLDMMNELDFTARDTSLTTEDAASCEWPNATSAPSSAWPKQTPAQRDAELSLNYAKGVEMNNGRWAMIGFALAILVEAGTGAGVLEQILFYVTNAGAILQ